jgi:hypothetical protein
MSKYSELRMIDVSSKIEKKNNLSYLSWAWAVDTLLQHDPMATWTYGQPVLFGESVMVFCTVNAFGKSMTAQLPVMDFRNKAIPNPDAFAVNTAMQRCLAKAIALHGLGLYIYAGEDLPQEEVQPIDVSSLIADIANSKDMEQLKVSFAQAYKVASKDKEALKLINDAKESKKKELA